MRSMIEVAKDDVLRALKKFKRLAKQDLLASPLMSDPSYWSAQATARRATYDTLTGWIEQDGVEAAYRKALEQYAALPLILSADVSKEASEPTASGRQQALELFFTLLGVDSEELNRVRRPARPTENGRVAAVKAGT